MKRLTIFLVLISALFLAAFQSNRDVSFVNFGASLPATCAVGQVWVLTSGTLGVYGCTSANTWTLGLPTSGTGSFTIPSGSVFGWNTAGADTGLSRDSVDVVDVGNGTAGDKSGTIKAAFGTFSALVTAANTQRLTADATPIATTTPGTAILSWSPLQINANYSFHCEILYTQQTAAGGVGLSVQAATNSPTRLDAWGNIFTSNAGVAAEGSAVNITNTTATAVVSGTPSATGTVFQATLNGTIQVGALSPTLTVLMFTGAGADTVTPKAGSFCTITP